MRHSDMRRFCLVRSATDKAGKRSDEFQMLWCLNPWPALARCLEGGIWAVDAVHAGGAIL